jgi:hypothetical protein
MEPPPAPMVAISIIGVRTTMPKSIEVCGASIALPAGDQRDVEAGAAHVAGDDIVEARRLGDVPAAITPGAGADSAVRTGRRQAVSTP